ncbi:MAG: hypothetical protein FJY85_21375 [Deltaproteobacteria bacterium]|nr:hypothetical protein [Deltaproteobacteria bacterium]
MKTYTFHSKKGGVGCTTVASSVACLLAGQHKPTLLVDAGTNRDTYPWLGALTPTPSELADPVEVQSNLWVVCADTTEEILSLDLTPYAYVVVDAGQRSISLPLSEGDERVLVTRNDYLALRNAVATRLDYTRAVLITEPERALTIQDCKNVLGVETLPIEWLPALSRAIDAGLASMRVASIMGDSLSRLVAEKAHAV